MNSQHDETRNLAEGGWPDEELKDTELRPISQRKRLHVVQAGAAVAAAIIVLSGPAWDETSGFHELIETTGLALVLLCVTGRLWSILYIGGKKNLELVTWGPYSMTRNPLYFFSTIGATGIGLMFGSVLAALLLGLLSFQLFAITASREATYLKERFGPAYNEYAHVTPLFWPNPMRYRDVSEGAFSPRALKRTFIDGLYFLAVFPGIEAVEYLQRSGVLPILLRLY